MENKQKDYVYDTQNEETVDKTKLSYTPRIAVVGV